MMHTLPKYQCRAQLHNTTTRQTSISSNTQLALRGLPSIQFQRLPQSRNISPCVLAHLKSTSYMPKQNITRRLGGMFPHPSRRLHYINLILLNLLISPSTLLPSAQPPFPPLFLHICPHSPWP